MMFLFGMECKKIAKSILYGALVLALLVATFFQYEPAVKSELQRTNDPASVFYTTSSGNYAEERSGVPDEAMEHAMMIGATNRLINNYRSNHYEYCPFGYVKEKTMSAREQAVVLQYLMELTGLRACLKNVKTPKRRIFFRCTALKNLEIHKVFLRFFALSIEKISRFWSFRHLSNKP